jgi:RNA polymerase sigma-70 factor (ECF subfamily)
MRDVACNIPTYTIISCQMDPEEEIIWKKIQVKDNKAFESYYKMHYKSFFLMACRYLKNTAQAEEIVNDVFIKIWEDGNTISIDSSLKSYIYRAIINRSLNEIQKNKRDSNLIIDLYNTQDESYELRQIEETELKTKLFDAIELLPEQCKKVFQLSRFEELKQQEIADRLGISIKTVKNHITHALKEISKSIDGFIIAGLIIIQNILRLY